MTKHSVITADRSRMEMVAVAHATVPGLMLTRPEWLTERISDMGISWGTGDPRVSGTLWWCMAASSLVDPVATAYAEGRPAPLHELERLQCEVRTDGGIERVTRTIEPSSAPTGSIPREHDSDTLADLPRAADSPGRAECEGCAGEAGAVLQRTLERIIPVVAEVSGASVASLWAIVADAIGNRALDSGAAEAGARLAAEIAGRLPMPRFTDIGGRTFVRRISCCMVYEVPGCQMCTSCPKRPAAERDTLLAELAGR